MFLRDHVKSFFIIIFISVGVAYTALYNLLNYPAGCVPVTTVTADDEAAMQDYPTNTQTLKYIKKVYLNDIVLR